MSEKMRAGFYCGRVRELNGRRALIRTDVDGLPSNRVLVQFDEPAPNHDALPEYPRGLDLSHGWHRMARTDFDLDEEYEP